MYLHTWMHTFSFENSFHFLSLLSLVVFISLARQCAQLWLKTRESLGHPLGTISEPDQLVCPKEILEAAVQRVSLYLLVTCIFFIHLQLSWRNFIKPLLYLYFCAFYFSFLFFISLTLFFLLF